MLDIKSTAIDPVLENFIVDQGLATKKENINWVALTGGISSEILRIDTATRSFCVKRALSQLKVEAVWEAPVSRNAYEWEWLKFAASISAHNVPELLAHDAELGAFAMAFLEPESHPVWKSQLMSGTVDIITAGAVGDTLGRLHAASANRDDIAVKFDNTDIFSALRLEPYLLATAEKHPELRDVFLSLIDRTATTRIALVHGDISPKNILIGPNGPIILDAETAWYGDPAFDLAFCLNHLLMKCFVNPSLAQNYIRSFEQLMANYISYCNWEPVEGLEKRIASLLPALMLARVDGKSPLEYITQDETRNIIRQTVIPMLKNPPQHLQDITRIWLKIF
jgi:aminoglycoside phosphotransferase (APT) family kinase protein